ncbi:MAG: hypothetical protein ACI3ZR_10355 [bacterium]
MIDLTVENADQIWRADIQNLFGIKFGNKLIPEEMKKNQIRWWNSTVEAVLKYKRNQKVFGCNRKNQKGGL